MEVHGTIIQRYRWQNLKSNVFFVQEVILEANVCVQPTAKLVLCSFLMNFIFCNEITKKSAL
jgi:hypothetical protein